MRKGFRSMCPSILAMAVFIGLLVSLPVSTDAQERRVKARISNAGFTMTALPLLAAKDWGVFAANGLDMEVILMQSALVPAALLARVPIRAFARQVKDPAVIAFTTTSSDAALPIAMQRMIEFADRDLSGAECRAAIEAFMDLPAASDDDAGEKIRSQLKAALQN